MKNVRNQELGFEDNKGKQEWYDEHPSTVLPITRQQNNIFIPELPGKDEVFAYEVVRFCAENKIRTVLDVGAAYGRYTAAFYDLGYMVTAMEISPKNAELLKTSLDTAGLKGVPIMLADFEEIDAFHLPVFDLIFMSDIVEHFIDWRSAMAKAARHCKYCYVLIPGDKSWNWSPDHLHEFGDKEMEELKSIFQGTIYYSRIYGDAHNWWHAAILKGERE